MNRKLHPIILCICSYSDMPLTSRWFTQSALVKYLCCFHNTYVSKCFEDNIYLTQEKLLIRYPGKDHWCTSKNLEDYSHISKDIRNSYPPSVKWTEKKTPSCLSNDSSRMLEHIKKASSAGLRTINCIWWYNSITYLTSPIQHRYPN